MYSRDKHQSVSPKKQQSEAQLDQLYTQQVVLPQFSNQILMSLPRTNSLTIQKFAQNYLAQFSRNENITYTKNIEKQIQRRLNSKHTFSKAHLIQLNKKQRVTRKNHYRYASNLNNDYKVQLNRYDLALDAKQSNRLVKISQKETAIRRNLFSAFSTRSEQRDPASNNYLRSISLNTEKRPMTAIDKKRENLVEKQQVKQNNARIIYPFQTKIKIKRVDENPKVLASILTKKHKTMQRAQLYTYINKLITRRPEHI